MTLMPVFFFFEKSHIDLTSEYWLTTLICLLLNWHAASLLTDIAPILKTFNPNETYVIYFRNAFLIRFSGKNYYHQL